MGLYIFGKTTDTPIKDITAAVGLVESVLAKQDKVPTVFFRKAVKTTDAEIDELVVDKIVMEEIPGSWLFAEGAPVG